LRLTQRVSNDYGRAGELVSQYSDLRLDAVDAMVTAVAERLGITTVATVDRRDFSVIRPRHVDTFEFVPELNPR
jgi:predicted nucleic acid-binding protein